MYHIQLMLTKKCNQDCYYCTTKRNDGLEVDLDYLKWVMDQFPEETGVELTGGEIGLIENIDEVYKVVKDHPKIKHIAVLSNGLVRKRGVDWLSEVEYWEHLIYDIRGREIIKFYNDLNFTGDHTFIIVTTDITTKSLLNHWKYFEELGLFRPNFMYKIMNHKAKIDVKHFYKDLLELYTRMNNKYGQRMLTSFKVKNYLKEERLLCQQVSPNPYVDIQEKMLGHCAININTTVKVPYSGLNLLDLICGQLSDNRDCRNCYSFDNGKNRTPFNNRSYEQ